MTDDMLGKICSWKQNDIACQARVALKVGEGKTSLVYLADPLPDGLNQPAAPVIAKVFRSDTAPAPDSETDFIPEHQVVMDLHQAYAQRQKTAPLPWMASGEIEGTAALVMPFYPQKDQLLARRLVDPAAIISLFPEICLQIVDLYQTLEKQDRFNLDTKDENFYWHHPDGLVVLDWNRTRSIDAVKQPARYRSAQRETCRLLAELFYLLYTTHNPPSPLPTSADVGWPDLAPRFLRRLLIDSSQQFPISLHGLRQCIEDYAEIARYVTLKDLAGLASTCEKWQKSDNTLAVQRFLDAGDAVSQAEIPIEENTPLSSCLTWANNQLRDYLGKFASLKQEVEPLLKKLDTSPAFARCEQALADLTLLAPPRRWALARLYLIATELKRLQDIREINTYTTPPEVVERILKAFADGTSLPDEAPASLTVLWQATNSAEEALQDLVGVGKDALVRWEKWQQVQPVVQSLAEVLPAEVYNAFLAALPAWVHEDPQESADRAQVAQQNQAREAQLVTELQSLFSEGKVDIMWQAALQRITPFMPAASRVLQLAYAGSQAAVDNRLMDLLNTAELLKQELLGNAFKGAALRTVKERIQKMTASGATLYAPQLRELREMAEPVWAIDQAFPWENARLDFVINNPNISLDDEVQLSECQKWNLEPGLQGPEDREECGVEVYLERLRVAAAKREIEEQQARMENINAMLPKLQDLTRQYEDVIKKFTEQEQRLKETLGLLPPGGNSPGTSVEGRLEAVIADRMQMNEEIGRLRQETEALTVSIAFLTGRQKELEEQIERIRKDTGRVLLPADAHLFLSRELVGIAQWQAGQPGQKTGDLAQAFETAANELVSVADEFFPSEKTDNVPERANAAKALLQQWSAHLKEISKTKETAEVYKRWINAVLSPKEQGETGKYQSKLPTDELPTDERKKPLFIYLRDLTDPVVNITQKNQIDWDYCWGLLMQDRVSDINARLQELPEGPEKALWGMFLSQFDRLKTYYAQPVKVKQKGLVKAQAAVLIANSPAKVTEAARQVAGKGNHIGKSGKQRSE